MVANPFLNFPVLVYEVPLTNNETLDGTDDLLRLRQAKSPNSVILDTAEEAATLHRQTLYVLADPSDKGIILTEWKGKPCIPCYKQHSTAYSQIKHLPEDVQKWISVISVDPGRVSIKVIAENSWGSLQQGIFRGKPSGILFWTKSEF